METVEVLSDPYENKATIKVIRVFTVKNQVGRMANIGRADCSTGPDHAEQRLVLNHDKPSPDRG